MTDKPLCAECGRPIHDTAYVCQPCTADTSAALIDLDDIAEEITTTLARLDRVQRNPNQLHPQPDAQTPDRRPGLAWLRSNETANALKPTPLLYNALAAAALDTLTAMAAAIAAARGTPGPNLCQHRTCGRIRAAQAQGPTCPHSTAQTAAWLRTQLDWLRYRETARDDLRALHRAAKTLTQLVDNPPQQVVVGQCQCGRYLYAIKGASMTRCGDCGRSYDVATSREQMVRYIEDALLSAAEIGRLCVYLGLETSHNRVRKLITVWGQRKLLAEHKVKGETCYRFGDALTKLARQQVVA